MDKLARWLLPTVTFDIAFFFCFPRSKKSNQIFLFFLFFSSWSTFGWSHSIQWITENTVNNWFTGFLKAYGSFLNFKMFCVTLNSIFNLKFNWRFLDFAANPDSRFIVNISLKEVCYTLSETDYLDITRLCSIHTLSKFIL